MEGCCGLSIYQKVTNLFSTYGWMLKFTFYIWKDVVDLLFIKGSKINFLHMDGCRI